MSLDLMVVVKLALGIVLGIGIGFLLKWAWFKIIIIISVTALVMLVIASTGGYLIDWFGVKQWLDIYFIQSALDVYHYLNSLGLVIGIFIGVVSVFILSYRQIRSSRFWILKL